MHKKRILIKHIQCIKIEFVSSIMEEISLPTFLPQSLLNEVISWWALIKMSLFNTNLYCGLFASEKKDETNMVKTR